MSTADPLYTYVCTRPFLPSPAADTRIGIGTGTGASVYLAFALKNLLPNQAICRGPGQNSVPFLQPL